MSGAEYKAIRKELGLTQPALAQILGRSVITIKRRENGTALDSEAVLAMQQLRATIRRHREPQQRTQAMKETQTQALLRNAKQALEAYRQQENEARKALASASESVRKAKEKYEALFLKEQEEAVKAMKADYMHCTK